MNDMKELIKKYVLVVLGIMLIGLSTAGAVFVSTSVYEYKTYLKKKAQLAELEREQEYTQRAARIVDYYYRQSMPVRFNVIKETLKAIDYYLPLYFPEGPFTTKDFIALAMVESDFTQYMVGTSGEKGIFQIMEESSKWMGVTKNQFDIEVNTELSMFVLREKFKQHPDYRKAIIAYNGVVVRNHRWDETYWKRFTKAKTVVDFMFKNSQETADTKQ